MTTHPGGVLLKGEVLGSSLTNNLIMELERIHNGGVGVGALQRCESETHGAGSSHGTGCHINLECLYYLFIFCRTLCIFLHSILLSYCKKLTKRSDFTVY